MVRRHWKRPAKRPSLSPDSSGVALPAVASSVSASDNAVVAESLASCPSSPPPNTSAIAAKASPVIASATNVSISEKPAGEGPPRLRAKDHTPGHRADIDFTPALRRLDPDMAA